MSGIMRAPSQATPFAIPYSGTRVIGDCILVVNAGDVDLVAVYDGSGWLSISSFLANFSDENNVISFRLFDSSYDSRVAFIPGPNHV